MEYSMRPVTAPAQSGRRLLEMQEDQNDGGALERFIAQELSNEPFELELNAASFSYLSKEELLEILDKILETVSPEKMESIYVAENKTDTIVEFLRILRYRPLTDDFCDLEKIRDGIEDADAGVLIPLMAWLLANMPTLKTRAYLSKYLIKINIPEDMLCDEDIGPLYMEYEAEIEKFKKTHKLRESMVQKRPLLDVKEDALFIQQDIDCLKRKIEMAKAKVSGSENAEGMVELIRQLRSEKLKRNALLDQEALEISKGTQSAGRMEYLRHTYKEICVTNKTLTHETLIDRELQEVANTRQMVNEKLPKAIAKVQRKIRSIRSVFENAPRSVNDLEETRRKSHALEVENKRLEKALDIANAREVSKDVLAARKEAELARRHREDLVEYLKTLEENCEIQRSKLTRKSLDALTKRQREEDDQDYVQGLRSKAKIYLEKKAELKTLRAQLDTLYKTRKCLDQDLAKSIEAIENVEARQSLRHGQGDRNEKLEVLLKKKLYDQKTDLGEKIEDENTLSRLKGLKSRLKPLLQIVESQRQQMLMLVMHHRQLKHKYEQAAIDSQTENLNNLMEIKENVSQKEMEILTLGLDEKFKRVEYQRAQDSYGSSMFKERLLGKIVEQERIHRQLTEQDAELEQSEKKSREQQQIFTDVNRLLRAKMELLPVNAFKEEEESKDARHEFP